MNKNCTRRTLHRHPVAFGFIRVANEMSLAADGRDEFFMWMKRNTPPEHATFPPDTHVQWIYSRCQGINLPLALLMVAIC